MSFENFPKMNKQEKDLEAMEDAIDNFHERTKDRDLKHRTETPNDHFFSHDDSSRYSIENLKSMNLEDLEYLKRDVELNGTKQDKKLLNDQLEKRLRDNANEEDSSLDAA